MSITIWECIKIEANRREIFKIFIIIEKDIVKFWYSEVSIKDKIKIKFEKYNYMI